MGAVTELREAYWKWMAARQKRYNEIMQDWYGDRASSACFDAHKRAVKQIDDEQSQPTTESC